MTAAPPLRVALVAPYDLSAAGGINNQIRGQARALRRLGHSVQVFGPASGVFESGERSLGRTMTVTLGGTESGLGVDPRSWPEVGRMLSQPFDIVHVHEPLTPLVPWMAVLRSRAPIVGTFHVHREDGHRLYGAFGWALKPIMRRLRARIAVSEAARRTVAEHFPGEYEIVPNGIDVGAFRAGRPRPSDLAADRRYVVYVGRLEPRKGVEQLIRAMPAIQRQAPDAALAIVGEGAERAALAQVARDEGAAVQFAGRVDDGLRTAYLQAADVVCSPALGGESFGIVLLEAMACGKPVVASRIEGYEALVGASGGARLVPAGDPAALATEVNWLFGSAERRRALGDRGSAFVDRYDWSAVATQLEAVYRTVLGT